MNIIRELTKLKTQMQNEADFLPGIKLTGERFKIETLEQVIAQLTKEKKDGIHNKR